MSIDMSQLYQIFYEEAAENLASMESLLLAINVDAPEDDQLNAIFRAAHSIKGGSSTFGFDDLAQVTHHLETLLDGIRKHETPLSAGMVETFLQAGDVLRVLLEGHQNGTRIDPALSDEIRARLAKLAGGQRAEDEMQQAESLSSAVSTQKNPNIPVPAQAVYQIRFANSPTLFPCKEYLDNLLEELGHFGPIANCHITGDSVSLTLTSDISEAGLRETLAFFLQPDELTIKLIGDQISTVEQHEDEPGDDFFVVPEPVKAQNVPKSVVGVKPAIPVPAPLQQAEIPPAHDNPPPVTAAAETSIRVSVAKVDQLINLVGELVISKSILAELVANLDPVLHESLFRGWAQLELNTRELQEAVMSVRMMPINFVFSRFPRLVRDLAQKLDKKAQFRMIGEGTELDKGLIEKISDPLIHLVRNSMDHGIETPQERIAGGKDPQGTITLSAAHQGGNIVIQVADDGKGLNRLGILAKAREKGIPFDEDISDAEVWQMIYAPGFSTAAAVTDVSGRGVGMDVVKRDIESIGGRVEISSRAGFGSTFTIRLPLTLAILDGLSVTVGEQFYIIPLSYIIESLQPLPGEVKEVSGHGRVLHVRGEYLPVIALHEVFSISPDTSKPEEGILVLLEAEGKKVALLVDNLLSQHQVVIKSLETNFRKVPGISGATIMGDGRVALIVDVSALVRMAQK